MFIFSSNSYTSSDTWIDWIIWTRSRTKHLSLSINSLLGLWILDYSVWVERFERWTRFSIYWTQNKDISNHKITVFPPNRRVPSIPIRSFSAFLPTFSFLSLSLISPVPKNVEGLPSSFGLLLWDLNNYNRKRKSASSNLAEISSFSIDVCSVRKLWNFLFMFF